MIKDDIRLEELKYYDVINRVANIIKALLMGYEINYTVNDSVTYLIKLDTEGNAFVVGKEYKTDEPIYLKHIIKTKDLVKIAKQMTDEEYMCLTAFISMNMMRVKKVYDR